MREIQADIVALQEVELLREQPGLLEFFCEDSPWSAVHGPTLEHEHADYGNALLTSLPVMSLGHIDLSQPGREPRGAINATLQNGKRCLGVVATHLGLRPAERRDQVRQLLELFQQNGRGPEDCAPSVLMGDLNEWFLWGRPLRHLRAHFSSAAAPATFPAGYPLFALDRIWADPANCLSGLRVHNTVLSRMASDHLPLVAELQIEDC